MIGVGCEQWSRRLDSRRSSSAPKTTDGGSTSTTSTARLRAEGISTNWGIDEYWIIDALKKQMTVLQRWRGQWKPQVVKPPKKYTTRFLRGFALDLRRVIAAAAPRSKGRNGK